MIVIIIHLVTHSADWATLSICQQLRSLCSLCACCDYWGCCIQRRRRDTTIRLWSRVNHLLSLSLLCCPHWTLVARRYSAWL